LQMRMENLGNRAGGACNGYFATPTTGVSGFDSRQERNLLKLNGEHREKDRGYLFPGRCFL
jgi:hypothetical protein